MVASSCCRSRQVWNLVLTLFCCLSFICKGSHVVVIERPEMKALMNVFGKAHDAPQRMKLVGTPYQGNLLFLEEVLKKVAVNRTLSFGRDWSYQRAKMLTFLKETFGGKLLLEEMNTLLGEVTLRAYMQMHSTYSLPPVRHPTRAISGSIFARVQSLFTEDYEQAPVPRLSATDFAGRIVLELVFGQPGSEKRQKLIGTPFASKLAPLLRELQMVTVELDWETEKQKKRVYLDRVFGTRIDETDREFLLIVSKDAYDEARNFKENKIWSRGTTDQEDE